MGVINYSVLLDALHNGGRDDALVTDLTDPNRPGYAQILKEGATFTWESWDARLVGDSESHGWGATVLSVLQDDVLGARVTTPGGAEITVAAPKSSITKATGVVTTQRGPVPIAWTRTAAGGETIDLTVPANMTATVHLSGTAVADVSESSRPVTGDAGISNARAGQGEVVMTVGSGHYSFANTKPTVIPAAASTATSTSHTALFVGVGVGVGAVAVALLLFGIVRRRRRAA
jgi:alpha-L-rhamnosidase